MQRYDFVVRRQLNQLKIKMTNHAIMAD